MRQQVHDHGGHVLGVQLPVGAGIGRAIVEARGDRARAHVRDADAVYTDVWASMGQEDEIEERSSIFNDYRVDEEMMAWAKPDALFMHCLPAHRGQEVTAPVIDGPNSIVYDIAENRLHVQKAVLVLLMRDKNA